MATNETTLLAALRLKSKAAPVEQIDRGTRKCRTWRMERQGMRKKEAKSYRQLKRMNNIEMCTSVLTLIDLKRGTHCTILGLNETKR